MNTKFSEIHIFAFINVPGKIQDVTPIVGRIDRDGEIVPRRN
jgi:hypothetical protein